ncbi:hypothetical protein EON80_06730 [bacterium]|nr:MAG: hypothetical protein EON80_06730 [bacterium]
MSIPFVYIPGVLLGTLLVVLQGFACYTLCQRGEKRWARFPYIAICLVMLAHAYLAYLDKGPLQWFMLALLLIYAVPALLGGWFHRLLVGKSKSFFAAFLLSLSSIWLSILLSRVLNSSLNGYVVESDLMTVSAVFYTVGVPFCPVLAPVALYYRQRQSQRIAAELALLAG